LPFAVTRVKTILRSSALQRGRLSQIVLNVSCVCLVPSAFIT
jgi:hypothetical protein